ncbi:MAG: DUF4432 family protein [Lachnospiraceae bacterium]|nr:DUF4432 family protein [Lachnospiraceae bacterium]
MQGKEPYFHTRNYGCRIRHYFYHAIEMLSLENDLIKVVLSLGKGADIVEFVWKQKDVDFMWHSFNEQKNINHQSTVASGGGNFLDSYGGGWQELFPTYGGNTLYRGGQIGVHGEACLYPWSYEVLLDTPECISVHLSLRTIRTPFLLEKKLTLREHSGELAIEQACTNLGSTGQQFMWGHHPAFGFPFLDESVRLRLKGTPHVRVPAENIAHRCPFDKETEGPWPMLPGKDGNLVDMSRAYDAADRLYMEYCISDLAEGAYELVNENLGLGMRMTWDKQVFRYLWIWGMYCGHEEYPWYGRAYTMGVEPWSSMPGSYDAVLKKGEALSLEPGETMRTWLNAEAFVEKE